MKKLFFGIVINIFVLCGVYAQEVRFGVRGGLSLPNILAGSTKTPVSEGYNMRLAGGFGIFTELQLNNEVSLRFGVEYSGLGGKKEGMQAMPTQRLLVDIMSSGMTMAGPTNEQLIAMAVLDATLPRYYYANIDNVTKFDYVMIPVLAQYGWDIGQTPWRVHVNAGPFVSFILRGKQVASGNVQLFSDASATTTLWDYIPDPVTIDGFPMPIPKSLVGTHFPEIESALKNQMEFDETNITGELKSANFGITGNVGLSYMMGRHNFFVEAGGNYGFVTIQSDDANGNNRLGAATIMLGYLFSIF